MKKSLLMGFLLIIITHNKSFAIDTIKKKKKSKCIIHTCSSIFYDHSKCKKFIVKKKIAESPGNTNHFIIPTLSDETIKKYRLCIKWKQ